MITTLVAAAVIAGTLATPAISSSTELGALPAGWRADLGIPVAYDDSYIYLYGDSIPPEGGMYRNAAIIDGTVIAPALADTASGHWYWPTDAIDTPAGLFVVALEMREGGWLGYEPIDTDAFLVTDARNPMSWKLAVRIEDGPWGDRQVQFSDQMSFAFVRDPFGLGTTVYEFFLPYGEWVELGGDAPDSHGVFAPVQTGDGWYGYSWEMWWSATLWRGDGPGGPWEPVEHITTPERTYDHGLNVIDGQVVYRWSNGEGDQRVHYAEVEL